ncbi:MAG: HAD family hydrolase [Eubacteriales bacterium]
MIQNIKAVFFDLFFTLIKPDYFEEETEYSILGITKDEWEHYAENDNIYLDRALGKVKNGSDIIDNIVATMPLLINEEVKEKLLYLRQKRMKNALQSIDTDVLSTLSKIKESGLLLGLISNADIIDCFYWSESPLAELFDDAVFSCSVGIMKPNLEIYECAMCRLNVKSDECAFVGDGGSDELKGAKNAGMITVFTEFLDKKDLINKNRLIKDCDYHIMEFKDLLEIMI